MNNKIKDIKFYDLESIFINTTKNFFSIVEDTRDWTLNDMLRTRNELVKKIMQIENKYGRKIVRTKENYKFLDDTKCNSLKSAKDLSRNGFHLDKAEFKLKSNDNKIFIEVRYYAHHYLSASLIFEVIPPYLEIYIKPIGLDKDDVNEYTEIKRAINSVSGKNKYDYQRGVILNHT